jgi:hypothetical protein
VAVHLTDGPTAVGTPNIVTKTNNGCFTFWTKLNIAHLFLSIIQTVEGGCGSEPTGRGERDRRMFRGALLVVTHHLKRTPQLAA